MRSKIVLVTFYFYLKIRIDRSIMKLFMSLRSINLTYNVTERTGMAGVIGSPGIFGNNSFYNSPGWNFIFGSQDSEIRRVAAENGWLVKNDYLNNPFIQSRSNNFQFRSSLSNLTVIGFSVLGFPHMYF